MKSYNVFIQKPLHRYLAFPQKKTSLHWFLIVVLFSARLSAETSNEMRGVILKGVSNCDFLNIFNANNQVWVVGSLQVKNPNSNPILKGFSVDPKTHNVIKDPGATRPPVLAIEGVFTVSSVLTRDVPSKKWDVKWEEEFRGQISSSEVIPNGSVSPLKLGIPVLARLDLTKNNLERFVEVFGLPEQWSPLISKGILELRDYSSSFSSIQKNRNFLSKAMFGSNPITSIVIWRKLASNGSLNKDDVVAGLQTKDNILYGAFIIDGIMHSSNQSLKNIVDEVQKQVSSETDISKLETIAVGLVGILSGEIYPNKVDILQDNFSEKKMRIRSILKVLLENKTLTNSTDEKTQEMVSWVKGMTQESSFPDLEKYNK